jgi:hypothetical protein
MYKWIIIICFTISMLFGIAIAIEPGQEQFIKEYVAAVNSKDVEKVKRLVHPKCLVCITDANRDYYHDYFSSEIEELIPDNYKITNIKPIGKDEPLLMSEAFSYPVRPTHWVQIDFERGPYDSTSILRQIIKSEDTWFMVLPCPTPITVKQFRGAKIKKEKQKERAMVLFRELKGPLLSELKELLKEGKKIQAWKRYSAETGEPLSMAKEVLLLLNEFTAEKKALESVPREYKPGMALADIGICTSGIQARNGFGRHWKTICNIRGLKERSEIKRVCLFGEIRKLMAGRVKGSENRNEWDLI